MTSFHKVTIGSIALAVIALGAFALQGRDTGIVPNSNAAMDETDTMQVATNTVTDVVVDSGVPKQDMVDSDTAAANVGSYEPYSPDKIARAATGDVVLFFHASWCPSCRALQASIESNRKSIPSGLSILKADYDRESELKKKYGVTTQHTLVQVDAAGNLIAKWSGSPNLDSLLAQVQ
jgi:thiol-disulfide isomerase/thioredoxin